jgi:hypothetical protein
MSQSVQRPSAGRIVMFDSPDREQLGHFDGPVPAMITAVRGSTTVDLTIFRNMAQPLLLADVEFSDDPTAGMRWFWPPRV